MAERRPLGCGRFSEDEWAALVVSGPGDPLGARLLEHAAMCAACRADLDAYWRLSAQVRAAAADPGLREPVRAAFVDSVLAQAAREKAAPASSRARPRPLRPAWAAAAAVLLLAILLGGQPFLPSLPGGGPAGGEGSGGRSWPGGTILALSDVNFSSASGLTTRGVAAAATGDAAVVPAAGALSALSVPGEPESPSGAPIRATLGVASASAVSGAPVTHPPAQLKGGFLIP